MTCAKFKKFVLYKSTVVRLVCRSNLTAGKYRDVVRLYVATWRKIEEASQRHKKAGLFEIAANYSIITILRNVMTIIQVIGL